MADSRVTVAAGQRGRRTRVLTPGSRFLSRRPAGSGGPRSRGRRSGRGSRPVKTDTTGEAQAWSAQDADQRRPWGLYGKARPPQSRRACLTCWPAAPARGCRSAKGDIATRGLTSRKRRHGVSRHSSAWPGPLTAAILVIEKPLPDRPRGTADDGWHRYYSSPELAELSARPRLPTKPPPNAADTPRRSRETLAPAPGADPNICRRTETKPDRKDRPSRPTGFADSPGRLLAEAQHDGSAGQPVISA